MTQMSDIVHINPNRKYWFIRSESGLYYENFVEGNFVAIGWDYFDNLQYIKTETKDTFIDAIKKVYKDERAGYVYGQINRFVSEISVGDIVMVPSKDSKLISFGEITSDAYIEPLPPQNVQKKQGNEVICEFKKRRKVTWLKEIKKSELDPYLYKLIYTQGTVSNVTKFYSDFIDRTIHSFFIKGETAHLVLHVKKTKNIKVRELLPFIESTSSAIESLIFSKKIENQSKTNVEIKLNVQSPGPVEFIFISAAAVGVYFFFKYVLNGLRSIDQDLTNEYIESKINVEEINELLAKSDELKEAVEALGIKAEDELANKDKKVG
jgi:hypothetical protein